MKKYKIEKYNWQKSYLDCIWYDGMVAKINTKSGAYCIFANGQVKAKLVSKIGKEEIAYVKGNGNDFYISLKDYIKNDKELNEICSGKHQIYELEIYDNNWLEVDLLNNDEQYEELDILLDSASLKDAVKEVIKMIPDIEKECFIKNEDYKINM